MYLIYFYDNVIYYVIFHFNTFYYITLKCILYIDNIYVCNIIFLNTLSMLQYLAVSYLLTVVGPWVSSDIKNYTTIRTFVKGRGWSLTVNKAPGSIVSEI